MKILILVVLLLALVSCTPDIIIDAPAIPIVPTNIVSFSTNEYWSGNSFTTVDTTIIQSTDPSYDHMVLTGQYEFYAKEDPTAGQPIKFVYDEERVTGQKPHKTGFVTYQPHSLNWRNSLGQLEQISMPIRDLTLVDGNDLAYMNIYGSGLDLSYQYLQGSLKESLFVSDNESLPTPSQFIIDGGSPFLEWNFLLGLDASLEIYLDGELWLEKKSVDNVEFVSFYKDKEYLFGLSRVEAFTLDGSGYVEGWYNLKKQGKKLFISVNIPYAWLNDPETSYPLYIDPTTIAAVADEWRGGDEQGNNRRVFPDYVNKRWHVLYIDIGTDVHSTSAPFSDPTSWTDGVDVADVTSFQNPDFDAIVEQRDASTTYLHTAAGNRNNDDFWYVRCELTGTTPFISCLPEEHAFDASVQGGSSSDDAGIPMISIDDNNCVWIAFMFEEASELLDTRYGLSLIKEDSAGCGDGDWDGAADTDSAYPIYDIQSETGYPEDFPLAIESFGNGDFQLAWIDVTTAGSFDFETVFWNATTDAPGTQNTLDIDVEGNGGVYFINLVIENDNTIGFSMDDATADLDAYLLSGKNDATAPTQVDTTLGSTDVATESQTQFAVVNTLSSGNDDIILFSRGSGASDIDVGYAISPDGGATWQNTTIAWQNNVCSSHCKYISAGFNNETCSVLVIWQNRSGNKDVSYEAAELILNNTISPLSDCITSEDAEVAESLNVTFVTPTPADLVSVTNSAIPVNITSRSSLSTTSVTLDLNKTLVGWWLFNNQQGESDALVLDNSTYGYDLTCPASNCPDFVGSGHFGDSLSYVDGDVLELSDRAEHDLLGNFTIMFWVKPEIDASEFQNVVTKGIAASPWNPRNYGLFLQDETDLYFSWYNGGFEFFNTLTNPLTVGSWGHVAFVQNSTERTFYVNGDLIASEAITVGLVVNNNNLTVGFEDSNNLVSDLDDLQIHARVLSALEINATINASLFSYYRNITGLLNGDYTIKASVQSTSGLVNYTDERTITVSGVIGEADLNLSFGSGISTFKFEGCGSTITNTSSRPAGQTALVGVDLICNNGTAAGDVAVRLDSALSTGWVLTASTSGEETGHIILSTIAQVINANMAAGTCQSVWFNASCTNVVGGPGAYEIYNISNSA